MSRNTEQAAALGWRLGARLVDVITFSWLLAFVLIEIDQRLLGGDPLGLRPGRLDFSRARSLLLLVVLIIAYEVIPTAIHGVTVGKAMLGVRVRAVNGGSVGIAYSAVRAVVLYAPALFLGAYGSGVLFLLFITVAIPASGRGLHDRVAATMVVSLRRDDAPGLSADSA